MTVPTPRPRTKLAQERREDLMNAAQRLFLEQGIEPTTIEQITSAADVAKGTFYLHFSSKDDVRAALGERFAHQHLAKIKAAIAQKQHDDWKGMLSAWAAAGVASYLEAMQLHDALFFSARAPTREGQEGLVDNIVIDHLDGLLQAGIDAEAWTLDDPHFTAVFLFSGLHGVVDDAYSKEKQVNQSRLARRLERLCFRAVGLPLR
jgi:AcrR family transcriptional regulator